MLTQLGLGQTAQKDRPWRASNHSHKTYPNGHIWWMAWSQPWDYCKPGKTVPKRYYIFSGLFLLRTTPLAIWPEKQFENAPGNRSSCLLSRWLLLAQWLEGGMSGWSLSLRPRSLLSEAAWERSFTVRLSAALGEYPRVILFAMLELCWN